MAAVATVLILPLNLIPFTAQVPSTSTLSALRFASKLAKDKMLRSTLPFGRAKFPRAFFRERCTRHLLAAGR